MGTRAWRWTFAGIYTLHHQPYAQAWLAGLALYSASFVLDFFDGLAARALHQSSNFGAVLDMVTDRCSTAMLLMELTVLFPEYFFTLVSLVVLDFSSHWYQMMSAKGHHKQVPTDKNLIVRIYYGVYPLFAYACAGTEFFYIGLVVQRFAPNLELVPGSGITIEQVNQFALFPACVLKQIANVAQLCSGAAAVATEDVERRAKTQA